MSQKAVSDIVDELEWKVTNIADEEDITVIEENGKQKLKFADRNYEPLNDSGKGYKILRKNIQTIGGVRKNILTQDMINEPNTIYEIRYDFDLNGKSINIKSGCTLDFKGGSFSNGEIQGNSTIINSYPTLIFNNVTLLENFNSQAAYPEWFGAIADNSSIDNTDSINKCLSYFNKCCLLNGLYYVDHKDNNTNIILVPEGKILTSTKRQYGYSLMSPKKVGIALREGAVCKYVIEMATGSEVSNIYIIANSNVSGLRAKGSRMNIEAVTVINADTGINIEAFLVTLKSVHAAICNTGFKVTGNYSGDTISSENTSITLMDCYAADCKDAGYHLISIIYSNLINCACDNTGLNRFDKNTFKASYYLVRCSSVNLLGCGSEHGIKLLHCEFCNNSIINIKYIANYKEIVEKDKNFYSQYVYTKYISLCNINIYGEFYQKSSDAETIFVYLFDYDRETVNILNCKSNEIKFECSGNVSDTINMIKRNTILLNSAVELHKSLIFKGSTSLRPLLTSSDGGFEYYDTTLKKYIVWNGTEWTNMDGTNLI